MLSCNAVKREPVADMLLRVADVDLKCTDHLRQFIQAWAASKPPDAARALIHATLNARTQSVELVPELIAGLAQQMQDTTDQVEAMEWKDKVFPLLAELGDNARKQTIELQHIANVLIAQLYVLRTRSSSNIRRSSSNVSNSSSSSSSGTDSKCEFNLQAHFQWAQDQDWLGYQFLCAALEMGFVELVRALLKEPETHGSDELQKCNETLEAPMDVVAAAGLPDLVQRQRQEQGAHQGDEEGQQGQLQRQQPSTPKAVVSAQHTHLTASAALCALVEVWGMAEEDSAADGGKAVTSSRQGGNDKNTPKRAFWLEGTDAGEDAKAIVRDLLSALEREKRAAGSDQEHPPHWGQGLVSGQGMTADQRQQQLSPGSIFAVDAEPSEQAMRQGQGSVKPSSSTDSADWDWDCCELADADWMVLAKGMTKRPAACKHFTGALMDHLSAAREKLSHEFKEIKNRLATNKDASQSQDTPVLTAWLMTHTPGWRKLAVQAAKLSVYTASHQVCAPAGSM